MINTNDRWTILENFEYISPDGERFVFTTGFARAVLSFDGLGLPPVEYVTQTSPQQHGEIPVDFRYRPRIVQIVLREDGGSRAEYWEMRQRLVELMRPDRQALNAFQPGQLKVIRPYNMGDWLLDVLTAQGPSFSARSNDLWDEWGYTEALRFIAHDPIFYSADLKTFTIGPVEDNPPTNLVFPFTFRGNTINPTGTNMQFIEAGKYTFVEFYTLNYTGSFRAFPTLEVYGPVLGPNIYNYLTEERLSLNYQIDDGEIVTFYLPSGNKRVISSIRGDISNLIVPGSALTTFHFEPSPGAPNGQQLLGFWGTGAETGTTKVVVSYRDRYVGT